MTAAFVTLRAEVLHLAMKGEHIRFQFYHFVSSQRPTLGSGTATWSPPLDLYETKTQIVLELDLAGVRPDSVQLQFTGRLLKISGLSERNSRELWNCPDLWIRTPRRQSIRKES